MHCFPLRRIQRALVAAATLLLSAAPAACMGPIEPPCVICIDVTALEVEGTTVAVGDTVLVRAAPVFAGGLFLFYPSTVDARWSVSDPGIARLVRASPPPPDSVQYGAVLVIGLRPGVARVTARLGEAIGTADIQVVPRTNLAGYHSLHPTGRFADDRGASIAPAG